MFVCSKVKENNDCSRKSRNCSGFFINVKEWTGVHRFTSGVSPKIGNMLGEQITAGQLTNRGCTVVHIHVMMTTMIFSAGITTRFIDRLSNCIYD